MVKKEFNELIKMLDVFIDCRRSIQANDLSLEHARLILAPFFKALAPLQKHKDSMYWLSEALIFLDVKYTPLIMDYLDLLMKSPIPVAWQARQRMACHLTGCLDGNQKEKMEALLIEWMDPLDNKQLSAPIGRHGNVMEELMQNSTAHPRLLTFLLDREVTFKQSLYYWAESFDSEDWNEEKIKYIQVWLDHPHFSERKDLEKAIVQASMHDEKVGARLNRELNLYDTAKEEKILNQTLNTKMTRHDEPRQKLKL